MAYAVIVTSHSDKAIQRHPLDGQQLGSALKKVCTLLNSRHKMKPLSLRFRYFGKANQQVKHGTREQKTNFWFAQFSLSDYGKFCPSFLRFNSASVTDVSLLASARCHFEQ